MINMVGISDDVGMTGVKDDFEKQLNGIIDKQLEEIGFADLCRRIAGKYVDKIKKIDEDHKEIKHCFDVLGGRLDTLLAEQDQEEAIQVSNNEKSGGEPVKNGTGKGVIIIDDEEEVASISTNENDVSKKPLINQLPFPVTSATPSTSKAASSGLPASKLLAVSKPSSSHKKIESVILNLKASKASSASVTEPNTLNDLFSLTSPDKRVEDLSTQDKVTIGKPNGSGSNSVEENQAKEISTPSERNNVTKKIEVVVSTSEQTVKETDLGEKNSCLKSPSEMLNIKDGTQNNSAACDRQSENIESTEQINEASDQVKNNGQSNTVKTLPKILIQTKKNEEMSEDTLPPDLSQPLKVNTPSENPPDLTNSLLFRDVLSSPDIDINVSDTVNESPLKVSLNMSTDSAIWPHLDPADDIDVKDDPYLPAANEGSFEIPEQKDTDSDLPFVTNEDDTTKPASPLVISPDLEECQDSPLKGPIIVETSNSSKLITKIRLPGDFRNFEKSFSPKKSKHSPDILEAQRPTKFNRSFELDVGMTVYAQPYLSDIWYQAEILKKANNTKLEPKYGVRFSSGQKVRQKVALKNMASLDSIQTEEIELGSRIVAGRPSDTVNSTISKKYKDINSGTNINVMFAGIVAELACPENNNRYLVFFDDGYAQYLTRNRMFPVISPSTNVWDDVSEDCQEFIKEYLQEYPYRPLVCTKINSNMQTEWNGSWWKSKVVSIDASLVKVLFDIDKRSEWIYRGTTRLEPMYDHFAPPTASKKKKKRLTDSYVDERITHPNFGISRYSLKDPEGRQQREEWNIRSPVSIKKELKLVDEIVEKLQKPGHKTEASQMLSNLKSLKRSSSVLSSASDSSKASGDIKASSLHMKRQRLISDSESNHSAEGCIEKDSTISPKEAVGVLCALHTSPSGSEASFSSHRSFHYNSSPTTERSGTSQPEMLKLFEFKFIKNAREQGASYAAIAAHYRSIYPNCGVNRKNVARYCRKHGIQKDIDDYEFETSSAKWSDRKMLEKLNKISSVHKDVVEKSVDTRRGPHQCSEACIKDQRNLLKLYRGTYNYLAIPLALGWKRESCKRQNGYHRDIYYLTPCNRRLRNLTEVTRYLLETKATNICIDMFCFLSNISCRNQTQKPKPAIIRIDDLSGGKESCCIVCINEHTDEYPPKVSYAASRIKTDDVAINTDPGFLVGCDCTDNCQDKTKCGCAQLTIESSNAIDNVINPNAGYSYRRLKEHTISGIYECNQNCACSRDTCYNRVVQNGIQLRLQVFMTENRGWGLRCIDDIPKGTFICTYAGQVLNEHTANREGMDYGDEYLAELDHIEVVEKAKDGYESDVPELRNNAMSGESSDDESESGSDSSTSVLFISSDTSDSSDEEQIVLTDDEAALPPKPMTQSEVKNQNSEVVTSSVSSTGSSNNVSPTRPNMIGPNDVVPCHITLQRIPSVDLPKRIDSTDESFVTDDSNSGCIDACSSLGSFGHEGNNARSPASSTTEDLLLQGAFPLRNDQNPSESAEPNISERTIPMRLLVPVARKSTCQKAYALKSTGSRVVDEAKMNGGKEDAGIDGGRPTMRSLYDGDKQMYIIDAKSVGNVGRYMNHSCAPNVFVQNVMVDTHDLRFPWVAFFAQQNICAYTELTWDYNYEPGSVPGKMLICKCGAKNCKGRLL